MWIAAFLLLEALENVIFVEKHGEGGCTAAVLSI